MTNIWVICGKCGNRKHYIGNLKPTTKTICPYCETNFKVYTAKQVSSEDDRKMTFSHEIDKTPKCLGTKEYYVKHQICMRCFKFIECGEKSEPRNAKR